MPRKRLRLQPQVPSWVASASLIPPPTALCRLLLRYTACPIGPTIPSLDRLPEGVWAISSPPSVCSLDIAHAARFAGIYPFILYDLTEILPLTLLLSISSYYALLFFFFLFFCFVVLPLARFNTKLPSSRTFQLFHDICAHLDTWTSQVSITAVRQRGHYPEV